ncbi:PRK06851 family protein [Candidatus Formimonas warabiya]|nr:PRK06851 family protein [Candidatus Formimonas warabiya]
MERVFILKGGPGTGKSTLMRNIGLEMAERGYNVEFWQCSSDNDSLDGVVIPDLKLAVVDGTAPHVVDPQYPGAVDQIVNLGDHWNEEYLRGHKNEIKKLTGEISNSFSTAYQYLKNAKTVYDEWKKINVAAMDFEKANQKTEKLMQEIFRTNAPLVRHMFAGAISPGGMVNFIKNITEDCKTRYILKGLPGTGKSSLIKKIVEGAVDRGYQADVYHCTLDPDSIDMAVIPQLGVAVLDGSVPHVEDPERPGDRVINMLDCLDLDAVGQKSARLEEIQAEFNRLMTEAISKITQAKNLHDALEVFYIKAMDFEAVDETRNQVLNKILAAAEKGDIL